MIGRSNSLGHTDLSLTTISGIAAMPEMNVEALGDPVQPDGPGGPDEPGLRVLDEVADQSGDVTHRHRDAEPKGRRVR